jgi:hypothetical protein
MTPIEVARLLPHSDPAVTLRVYAGLDVRPSLDWGEKLAAGLRPADLLTSGSGRLQADPLGMTT